MRAEQRQHLPVPLGESPVLCATEEDSAELTRRCRHRDEHRVSEAVEDLRQRVPGPVISGRVEVGRLDDAAKVAGALRIAAVALPEVVPERLVLRVRRVLPVEARTVFLVEVLRENYPVLPEVEVVVDDPVVAGDQSSEAPEQFPRERLAGVVVPRVLDQLQQRVDVPVTQVIRTGHGRLLTGRHATRLRSTSNTHEGEYRRAPTPSRVEDG